MSEQRNQDLNSDEALNNKDVSLRATQGGRDEPASVLSVFHSPDSAPVPPSAESQGETDSEVDRKRVRRRERKIADDSKGKVMGRKGARRERTEEGNKVKEVFKRAGEAEEVTEGKKGHKTHQTSKQKGQQALFIVSFGSRSFYTTYLRRTGDNCWMFGLCLSFQCKK